MKAAAFLMLVYLLHDTHQSQGLMDFRILSVQGGGFLGNDGKVWRDSACRLVRYTRKSRIALKDPSRVVG